MEHCQSKRPGVTTGAGRVWTIQGLARNGWRSIDLCAGSGADRGERQQGDRRGRTLPLSGRQGAWGGLAKSFRGPVHSRGLFKVALSLGQMTADIRNFNNINLSMPRIRIIAHAEYGDCAHIQDADWGHPPIV